jgi:hypothetical protein
MQNASSDGSGWHCAAEPARLCRFLSATEAKRVAGNFGNWSLRLTADAGLLVIFGRRMQQSSQVGGIKWWARKAEKLATWNAGTTRFASGFADLSVKPCLFQRTMKCTKHIFIYLFSTTTDHSKSDTALFSYAEDKGFIKSSVLPDFKLNVKKVFD